MNIIYLLLVGLVLFVALLSFEITPIMRIGVGVIVGVIAQSLWMSR